MRLDHLLSKENSDTADCVCSVLRSDVWSFITLFNLAGIGKAERPGENGGLAQLGERLPCKQEVSGSIPLISTYFL